MKILMVIGQFHPTIGGSERQCLLLSRALRDRGHEVQVVTIWYDRSVPQRDEVQGVPVCRVPYPIFFIGKKRIGFGSLAPLFLFLHLLRTVRDYDIIHVHQCLWPAFSAVCAARLRKKLVITKLANSGERFDLLKLKNEHLYGSVARWCIKRWMNMFIWTSVAVRDDLKSNGIPEERLTYIPNGVAVPEKKSNASNERKFTTFIFVGMLNKKKNAPALVKAVAQLSNEYQQQIRVVIVGDGPERKTIEELIKDEGVAHCVMLVGSKDDVTPYLCNNDVFVLPSFTEGLSNAVLEAMAYGLPLILSNAGGNRDLIREGENGLLIDPHDPKTLTRALQFMINNPEKRKQMGKVSRAWIIRDYSIDIVAKQYERLYGTL